MYIVGAWAVLQVADLAFESWGMPDAALRSVWIAALLLFPLALLFGWRYDITTGGIVRTPAAAANTAPPLDGRDYAIVAAIGVAIVFALVAVGRSVSQLPRDGADLVAALPALPLDERAIAVLPFRSLGSAEETGFFSDGVHDDLLTTLTNISDLKVISRTSVLQYRDSTKNLRDVGRELGVRNILEGGVQHVGGDVRINVQLINAETDEHIWAEKYDRTMSMENLFAIQSEIAETIAQSLTVTLSAKERSRIRRDRTDNRDAFDAYIRGKQRFARNTFESLRSALGDFQTAIELDPDYVLARTMLARTYSALVRTGAEPLAYMLDNGREHIDYAIALDPNDGHALAVLANYEAASGADDYERLFTRALQESPNNVEVLDIYATHLRSRGRNTEALEIIDRALTIDPYSTGLWHDRGRAMIALGRFEEANVAFRRIAEIDAKNPYASHGAALATILSGQLVEAAYWAEINAATDVDDYENTSTLANIYMSLGDFANAQRSIDTSLDLGPMEPVPLAVQAVYLALNEQREEAVAIARIALVNDLADRWGSERVFLRLLRDEALRTGKYDEAIGWYRKRQPELFLEEPEVFAPNVQRAADLGGLLLAAGQDEQGRIVLDAAIADYDLEYVRGSANWPMGIAKAEALAQLGQGDAAIDELQRVVDDGWRLLWQWDTRFNPSFDSVRNNPRFAELLRLIENDLLQQLETFEPPG